MHRFVATAFVACLVLSVGTGARGQDFEDVTIETQQMGDGVYMLSGRGGNIGVSVGDDGVFLIDDQFAPLTKKIRAAVERLSDGSIRFVINTHWHSDHTGGNENLGKAGAVIVAHENVRKRLSTDQFIEAFGRDVPASPKAALPVITFDDGVTFHLNGETIEVMHVEPSHTDGDSVIFFRNANVLHTGDVFFNSGYPFIDLSSGGSIDGMIANVKLLLERIDEDTRVIPGHGPASDRAGLQRYHDMLVTIRDRVARLIAEGRTRKQVQSAGVTDDYDDRWGQSFMKSEVFLGIVYDSLS